MALKALNLEQIKLEDGKSIEGFWVGFKIVPFEDKKDPAKEPSLVPRATLQDKAGKQFTVLLGATASDVVERCVQGAWTKIERVAVPGKRYKAYLVSQDEAVTTTINN